MEDDFLDHNEDMANVLAFFKNQKNIFDSAAALLTKLSTEQEYLQTERGYQCPVADQGNSDPDQAVQAHR